MTDEEIRNTMADMAANVVQQLSAQMVGLRTEIAGLGNEMRVRDERILAQMETGFIEVQKSLESRKEDENAAFSDILDLQRDVQNLKKQVRGLAKAKSDHETRISALEAEAR